MTESAAQFVIVGAGHAGGRAAEALRAAAPSARITIIGAETYPPYERPPLSKELLDGTMPVEKTYVRPPEWYVEANIELKLGCAATAIDRAAKIVHLTDGATVPYDRLLLTTGGRARRLKIAGADNPNVLYLRDIDDTMRIQERLKPGARVVVIGAGFIGLEVAASARKHGCEVTVLEVAPHPMGRVVAPEIGDWFAELHRKQGTVVKTLTTVTSLEPGGRGVRVMVSDGSVIDADIVVPGIGVEPGVELAEAAGLTVQDGILVDEFARTSDPDIFAAGDATRHFNPFLGRHIRLEAWQNAQNQAIAAAKIMAGGTDPYEDLPWAWTDQHGINFQVVGMPLAWDQLVWRGSPESTSFVLFYLAEGVPVAANTINSGREMRHIRQLIRRATPVDAAQLADMTLKLQDLARA